MNYKFALRFTLYALRLTPYALGLKPIPSIVMSSKASDQDLRL